MTNTTPDPGASYLDTIREWWFDETQWDFEHGCDQYVERARADIMVLLATVDAQSAELARLREENAALRAALVGNRPPDSGRGTGGRG